MDLVDHVLFVVSDLAESCRLYTAALAPVGYEELHVQEDGVPTGSTGSMTSPSIRALR
jgi:catechol 2,3-dioxygenase-like lactoylglutathione lyase family enzyme